MQLHLPQLPMVEFTSAIYKGDFIVVMLIMAKKYGHIGHVLTFTHRLRLLTIRFTFAAFMQICVVSPLRMSLFGRKRLA
jgi:hypothetical protein